SGYDLCRLLKRDDATRAIPIVVVTGDGDPSDIDRAKHAGADAVLIKPCGAATVLAEVDRLIERSRTLQAHAAASPERAADDTAKADDVLNGSQANRPVTLSRILYRRYTTTPPIAPPELRCPVCGRPLAYRRSH